MDYIKVVGIHLVEDTSLWSETKIESPSDVIHVLMRECAQYDREVLFVLNLDTQNRIINLNVASMGTLNTCMVHPREIFKSSILSNAASIMLVHNHTSGDCKVSNEDFKITERIKKCGDLMGIPLLDHIVLGKGEYLSIKEKYDLL